MRPSGDQAGSQLVNLRTGQVSGFTRLRIGNPAKQSNFSAIRTSAKPASANAATSSASSMTCQAGRHRDGLPRDGSEPPFELVEPRIQVDPAALFGAQPLRRVVFSRP